MLDKVKAAFELSQKLTNVQKQVDALTIQFEEMNKQVADLMSRSKDMIETRNEVLGDHARLTSEFRSQKEQMLMLQMVYFFILQAQIQIQACL